MHKTSNKALLLCVAFTCLLISADSAAKDDTSNTAKLRNAIINSAKKYVGTSYRYGGRGSGGFDCSGFVQFIFHEHGIQLPRTAAAQYNKGTRIELSEAAAGDLVFFKIEGDKVDHVGIYMGNSEFIHSPSSGKKVRIDSIESAYWQARFAGAATFIRERPRGAKIDKKL